jgi:hypothetical protein
LGTISRNRVVPVRAPSPLDAITYSDVFNRSVLARARRAKPTHARMLSPTITVLTLGWSTALNASSRTSPGNDNTMSMPMPMSASTLPPR